MPPSNPPPTYTLRQAVLHWGPAAIYMAIIFALSSLSVLPGPPDPFPHMDKVAHFTEYAGLAFLCARATTLAWPTRPRWRTLGVAWLISAAFGFSDEVHQSFVPGRSPDVLDWFADAAGSLVGVLTYSLALRVRFLRWLGPRTPALESKSS